MDCAVRARPFWTLTPTTSAAWEPAAFLAASPRLAGRPMTGRPTTDRRAGTRVRLRGRGLGGAAPGGLRVRTLLIYAYLSWEGAEGGSPLPHQPQAPTFTLRWAQALALCASAPFLGYGCGHCPPGRPNGPPSPARPSLPPPEGADLVAIPSPRPSFLFM